MNFFVRDKEPLNRLIDNLIREINKYGKFNAQRFEERKKSFLMKHCLITISNKTVCRGRPSKPVNELKASSIAFKAKLLRQSNSEKVIFEAFLQTCEIKKRGGRKIISMSLHDHQHDDEPEKNLSSLNSPIECLRMITKMGLSKSSYQKLRNNDLKKRPKGVVPQLCSYKKVADEKKKCCVPIFATDSKVFVNQADFIKLTLKRLLMAKQLSVTSRSNVEFTIKIGADSAQSNTTYRHIFKDPDASDEHISVLAFVPLELAIDNIVCWKNSEPSSSDGLRYLKQFQNIKQNNYSISILE